MKQWLRRAGVVLFLLFWLAVMAFPVIAFLLATQQRIQIGDPGGPHLRLFMVQEAESDGVGLEWTRRAGESCLQTGISYFLWESNEENVSTRYCQCVDADDDMLQPAPLEACR